MSDEPPKPPPEQSPSPPPIQPSGFDYSQPPVPQPQFSQAQPQNDSLGRIIPTKNPKALASYYCGVFALVPCFSLVLGPLALILGVLGLKEVQRNPGLPGKGHAITGIVLGGIVTLAAVVLVLFVLVYGRRT